MVAWLRVPSHEELTILNGRGIGKAENRCSSDTSSCGTTGDHKQLKQGKIKSVRADEGVTDGLPPSTLAGGDAKTCEGLVEVIIAADVRMTMATHDNPVKRSFSGSIHSSKSLW